jgi:hypothetical protein
MLMFRVPLTHGGGTTGAGTRMRSGWCPCNALAAVRCCRVPPPGGASIDVRRAARGAAAVACGRSRCPRMHPRGRWVRREATRVPRAAEAW